MIAFILIFPPVAALLLYVFRSNFINRAITMFYSTAYLFMAVSAVFRTPSGLGKYFMIDPLNILFMLVTAIIYFGVSLNTMVYFRDSLISAKARTTFHISMLLFVFSMNGFILSQHLGLSWVFIEATTLTSAFLIYFDKTEASLDAAWKYLFICTIGISFAFVGILFISKGVGGSVEELFYTKLYASARFIDRFWINTGFIFIALGFGTKMGLAPMHSWLPDAHSEAPSPASAMLSGTLLNIAFLGILRVYRIMALSGNLHFARNILLVMGFLSLVFSAAFILKTGNYKKMLAYSSIENMGIIAIGLSLGGAGIFASFLHMVGHSLTKGSFFLTAGNILHLYGTKESGSVHGLMRLDSKTGILWLLSFAAITAFPPFPLFISEFIMIREMMAKGHFLLMVLFLLLLTVILYGLSKTVFRMLFGQYACPVDKNTHNSMMSYIPQFIMILLLIIIGTGIPRIIVNILKDAVIMIGIL